MKAVVLDVPQEWVEERARLGIDGRDELWEGVLHMVPPPGFVHQKVGGFVYAFLQPRLHAHGIDVMYETGVYEPGRDGKNYRVPDMLFFHAGEQDLVTDAGIEGAPLAVLELRSPGDETYEKFDFWSRLGVPEIVVIEPLSRRAEVHRLGGAGYALVPVDRDGSVLAAAIGVRFATLPGPLLRVQAGGEVLEV